MLVGRTSVFTTVLSRDKYVLHRKTKYIGVIRIPEFRSQTFFILKIEKGSLPDNTELKNDEKSVSDDQEV